MKRLCLILTLLLCGVLAAGSVSYAQSGGKKKSKQELKREKKRKKKEKKTWKKRAKQYAKNPLALRDDIGNPKDRIRELEAELSTCNKQSERMERSLDSLQNLLAAKVAELSAQRAKYEKLEAAYAAQKNINEKGIIPGLVYKVQIGAFVYFDINNYLKDTDRNFEGETADGMNKYTMGNFRDLSVADAFKKDIRKMGIGDAWVVPYIDGLRVTMQEAREYLGNQGRIN